MNVVITDMVYICILHLIFPNSASILENPAESFDILVAAPLTKMKHVVN